MKLRIEVGEFHIKYGEPRHPARCPLAYAIGPRTGGHVEVTEDGHVQIHAIDYAVRPNPVRIRRAPKYYTKQVPGKLLLEAPLPKPVFQWMQDFDAGKKKEPFSFELELPDDWRKKLDDETAKTSGEDRENDGDLPPPGL